MLTRRTIASLRPEPTIKFSVEAVTAPEAVELVVPDASSRQVTPEPPESITSSIRRLVLVHNESHVISAVVASAVQRTFKVPPSSIRSIANPSPPVR